MERQLLEFWKEGMVKLKMPYITFDISDIEKYVMLKSHEFDGCAFQLTINNPLDLLDYCEGYKKALIATKIHEEIICYNKIIYIPYSIIGD